MAEVHFCSRQVARPGTFRAAEGCDKRVALHRIPEARAGAVHFDGRQCQRRNAGVGASSTDDPLLGDGVDLIGAQTS